MAHIKTFVFSVMAVAAIMNCHGAKNNVADGKLLKDSVPQKWVYNSIFVQTLPSDDKWWRNFDDSCLDSLMDIAVQNNYDLLTAQKRIAMAKASMRQVQSTYYPTLSMDVSWGKNRTAGNLTDDNISPVNSDYFDLGLNFNWQIDVFGQIREQAKVKKTLWQASKSQYDAAMVTLCGNLATAYINLRTWQMEFVVSTTHLESQHQVLTMAEARYKSGLSSLLDVSQARMVYFSTLASQLPLKTLIETQINAIAILLGAYPQDLPQGVSKIRALPNVNAEISVGVPMVLLRRRPDIKSAEYTVASYAAALGIAKKDFLPVLSLSGQIGFKSHKIDDIFKDDAFNYSLQPTLTWTVFDGLNRKYQYVSAREQYMIGIDTYNNTVMTAVKEVQNAMITYKYLLEEVQKLEDVNNVALQSLKLSIDLYKRGLSAFTNVLASQQSYLQYNNSLVAAKGKALLALVSIYEALGGGWQTE